jgi:parallel beta-helix repeat protein
LRFLIAIAAAVALLPVGAAEANHVQCGDAIFQDTTLDSDLIDCPANGLLIQAPGVTVNLNGHVIDGVPSQSADGINNRSGYEGVTVKNGTIQQFRTGVEFEHADDGRLTRLHVRESLIGLLLQYSSRNRVDRNDVSAGSAAVELLDDSQSNLIEHNLLTQSGNGILTLTTTNDPFLPATHNRIARNRFVANGYGIFGYMNQNQIDHNLFQSNTEAGIELFSSGLNTIAANDFFDNAGGIELGGQTGYVTVSRNRVFGSDEDGISLLGSGAYGTNTFERNVSNGNGDDGIDIDTSHATITKNRADNNGDLGIEAVPGVSDGGRNKARGNGNPAQCVNVSCR